MTSKSATKIRVLVVRVGCEPELREIPAGVQAMQAIVGGTFTCMPLETSTFLYCNEDGLYLDLPVNDAYSGAVRSGKLSPLIGGPIVGDFFITRHDPPHTVSLTDADVAKYTAMFGGGA